jgi:hypothetical protein
MKARNIILIMVAILVALVLLGCGGAAQGPTPTPEPHPGQALIGQRCSTCHDLWRVESAKFSKEDWLAVVNRMVISGASLTAEEEAQVVDYLAITFPID